MGQGQQAQLAAQLAEVASPIEEDAHGEPGEHDRVALAGSTRTGDPDLGGLLEHLADEVGFVDRLRGRFERSEEHTSELQSLMRISYAVFCLKKKKFKLQTQTTLI